MADYAHAPSRRPRRLQPMEWEGTEGVIHRISVRNFRCLREVDLECSGLLALVGPNGSGKSALLHSLRFFFGELEVDDEDCWGGDPELTVEVALLIDVPADEEEFAAFRDDNGSMWVARRSLR